VAVSVGVGVSVGRGVFVAVGSTPGIPSEHPINRKAKPKRKVNLMNLVFNNTGILQLRSVQ
jgi:hypothetical protein